MCHDFRLKSICLSFSWTHQIMIKCDQRPKIKDLRWSISTWHPNSSASFHDGRSFTRRCNPTGRSSSAGGEKPMAGIILLWSPLMITHFVQQKESQRALNSENTNGIRKKFWWINGEVKRQWLHRSVWTRGLIERECRGYLASGRVGERAEIAAVHYGNIIGWISILPLVNNITSGGGIAVYQLYMISHLFEQRAIRKIEEGALINPSDIFDKKHDKQ